MSKPGSESCLNPTDRPCVVFKDISQGVPVVVKQVNFPVCVRSPWKFRLAVMELRNEIWAREVLSSHADRLGFHVPVILRRRAYLWGLLPVSLEMEHCEGRLLSEVLVEGREDGLCALLVEALKDASKVTGTPGLLPLLRDCAWYWRLLVQAKGKRARVLRALNAFVASLKAHCGVVHGDLYPRNILVRNESPRLVILDWGSARSTWAWQGYDYVRLFSSEKMKMAGLSRDADVSWEGLPGSEASTLDYLSALRGWVKNGRTVEGNPWSL